jgi:hypothetical protein
MAKSRKLAVERLEDRLTPSAWFNPWPNPGHMTLSFVPDGTAVNNYQSNLFQTLNGAASTSAWEQAILQAYQTWAINSNINIGVVADGGQPLGASGAVQGDARFGDIRIAMAAQPNNPDVADTVPYDLSGSTWDGDTVYNSSYNFGINGQGKYDLFSVALHEAAHTFGFPDQTTDPTSAMYQYYSGPRTGLSSGDITALQSLYGGPRSMGPQGNNSFATALGVTSAITADIGSLTTTSYFSFTTGAATSTTSTSPMFMKGATTLATTSFTVQVQTAGISLLAPEVRVFDVNHNLVAASAGINPLNNNVTIQINNAKPNAVYYVQVSSAVTSVFGIGSYQLSVQLPNSTTTSSSTNNTTTTTSTATTLATPQVLTSSQAITDSSGVTWKLTGTVSATSQASFYQVTAPTLPVSGPELLTVSAASTDNLGLYPYISIFDASGNALSYSVIDNGGGTFTAQLYGVAAGSVLFVEVSELPGATQNVGNYSVAIQFNNDAATTFAQLAAGTLSQTSTSSAATLSMASTALIEFALSAQTASAASVASVQMTITDQNNNTLLSLTAISTEQLSTSYILLSQGNYNVSFTAMTSAGTVLTNVTWTLSARALSAAQSPTPIDPTGSTTGTTSTGGGSSGGTTASNGNGTLPVINPISNPTTTASSTTTTSPTGSASTTSPAPPSSTTTASSGTGSTGSSTTSTSPTTTASTTSPAGSTSTTSPAGTTGSTTSQTATASCASAPAVTASSATGTTPSATTSTTSASVTSSRAASTPSSTSTATASPTTTSAPTTNTSTATPSPTTV